MHSIAEIVESMTRREEPTTHASLLMRAALDIMAMQSRIAILERELASAQEYRAMFDCFGGRLAIALDDKPKRTPRKQGAVLTDPGNKPEAAPPERTLDDYMRELFAIQG